MSEENIPKKKTIKVRKPKILFEDIPENKNGFSTRKFRMFSNILSLIADTTSEVNFNFTDEGIYIDCMDTGHISYLVCKLPQEFFDDFKNIENKTYGVNMNSLMKIFNISKLNTGLTAIFENDYIEFHVKSDTLDKTYNIRQMQIDGESLTIPDMDWEYDMILSSNDFYNVTHEIQDISESCELKIKKNTIQFKAEGIIGLVKIKMIPKDITTNTDDKFLKLGMSSKHLFHYAKARNLSDDIRINIEKNSPIKLTYELGDGGIIYNYIAPKIQ